MSPDAEEGGIWLGNTGPAADDQGNVFVPIGYGRFDAVSGSRDFGDSVLKLGPKLALMDWFTPFNQQELNSYDADLGSGGPVLLPDQPSLHRHLLIVAGKGGVLYVLDRDQMGKYHSGSNLHVVDSIPFGNSMAFGAPAYWNGHLFVVAADHGIEDFPLRREMLSRNPPFADRMRSILGDANGLCGMEARTELCGHGEQGQAITGSAAVLHAYEA